MATETVESPLNRDYPKQFGNIEKGAWRLKSSIIAGKSPEQLSDEEAKLWTTLNEIAREAPDPPDESPLFPNSKLIGHGWEWAVYKLPDQNKVAKVPAGIFPEVNDPKYLKNAKANYELCRQYFGFKALETQFQRRQTVSGDVNILTQTALKIPPHELLIPAQTPQRLRASLRDFGKAVLTILDEQEWSPDFSLRQMASGGWDLWNVAIVGNTPILYDFTMPYDVFRLYPQRTTMEVASKKRVWSSFVLDLENAEKSS